jgi:glycosyltransferase involved in cell wall biosynthesis
MDAAPPDYSIVLPAFNEKALLPATLEKLREATAGTPLRGELVVPVDGGNRLAGPCWTC